MKPKALHRAMLFTFAFWSISWLAPASDWPQWRGPSRNGISPENLAPFPPEGPKLLWSAAVGTGFSSLSINGSRLFTMGNTNEHDIVWCLDAANGHELWRYAFPSRLDPQYYEGGPGATPTVDHGQVFTINKWGTVLCLDAAKGSLIWQHNLWDEAIRSNRWGFAGSPLIWHDLVVLNAGGAGTALDRKTGRMVWFNGIEPAGYASPVLMSLAGKDIVLIFAAKSLVAVDPQTGRILWRRPFETAYDTNNPDPLIHGDTVFISSFSHGCELLRAQPDRAAVIYTNTVVYNHLSPGILLGDYLYAFNGEAHRETDLRCIHLPSGELKWKTKSPAFGSLIGTENGQLAILSEKGELAFVAASPAAFKPICRAQVMGGVCWTPPALANGRLFLRNAKGEVKCFEMEHPPAAPPLASHVGPFEAEEDIGAVTHPGSATFDPASNSFVIAGGGENMWSTNDAFHFVWKRVSGNFRLSATVEWPSSGGNAHRKACLLVRQDLKPESAYIDVAIHGNGLTSLQYRETPAGPTRENQVMQRIPAVVALERHGNVFFALTAGSTNAPSSDNHGALPSTDASIQLTLTDPVYVGLGVCAHDDKTIEKARFSNVKLISP